MAERIRSSARDPIWIAGHGTRIPQPVQMETIHAPAGIGSFVPEEMTVSCGAGTSVDELLDAVGKMGQYVNLPVRRHGSGTVGGALSVGEGDVLRLGRGSVRDVLLQADFVDGQGTPVRAGGPTVKNVSGFDVCRLLVGSCGRIGFLTDVILRTRPVPLALQWFSIRDAGRREVSLVMASVHKPSSVLWSGNEIHLCLEGHPEDLAEMASALRAVIGRPVEQCDSPDLRDYPHCSSRRPAEIDTIVGRIDCVAEIGTGVIHHRDPFPDQVVELSVTAIEHRLLRAFDPEDRLNGGTSVWGTAHRRDAFSRPGQVTP